MRGEIYVLSLLRASELARNVVTENLNGPIANNSPTAELTDPDRRGLAGPRYEYLAGKLVEAFQPAPPPRFTEANFADLFRREVQQEFARVLRCAVDDVLASLLDPVQLRRELDEVRADLRSQRLAPDAETLLYKLLAPSPGGGLALAAIRLLFQFGENEWGSHLQRRRWLLDSAVGRLQEEAARRGWTRSEPGRVLAGVIAGAGGSIERHSALEGQFDALAVVYLRRLLADLVSDLREEAEANIDRALSRASGMSGLVKLRGWIDLYERGNLARGLLKLSGGTVPLHQRIAKEHCVDKQVHENFEKPLQPGRLLVDHVSEFTRTDTRHSVGRKFVSFDIQCRFGEDGASVPVLSVSRLPWEEFRSIRPAIERIRCEDLSPVGTTVGQRILNTPIPSAGGLQGLLRGFVERNGPLVAQTIVLAGIRQPVTTARVPWRDNLRDHLGYAERSPARDVVFPQDLRAIVDGLTEEYESRNRELLVDESPQ